MNIVYFIFGHTKSYYQQAFFSIYTALANKDDSDQVIVITENALYFRQLADLITIIPISKEQINEWKGMYNYSFRVKIKALEMLSVKYPNRDMMFLDGDTFIYKPLAKLKAELSKGQHFFHLNEGTLPSLNTKSEKKLWRQIKHKKYAGITINEDTCMWNSGVIAMSAKNLAAIPLALQITDEMCADNVTCFTKEQLAFGIASSQFSSLKPADHVVGHYWANKEVWEAKIGNWLTYCMMTNMSAQDMIADVKNFQFDTIPVYVKYSSSYRKLNKLLFNMFKPKNAVFVTY